MGTVVCARFSNLKKTSYADISDCQSNTDLLFWIVFTSEDYYKYKTACQL